LIVPRVGGFESPMSSRASAVGSSCSEPPLPYNSCKLTFHHVKLVFCCRIFRSNSFSSCQCLVATYCLYSVWPWKRIFFPRHSYNVADPHQLPVINLMRIRLFILMRIRIRTLHSDADQDLFLGKVLQSATTGLYRASTRPF
jgi:hypothetical protein